MIPPATVRTMLNRAVHNLNAATDAARAAMTQFALPMPNRFPNPSQVRTASHHLAEAQRIIRKSVAELNNAATMIGTYAENLAGDEQPPAA